MASATETTINNGNNKEDSVSLSLSDHSDEHDNNHGVITISLKASNATNQKNLGITVNRAKFMQTAPSLMRLLSIGKSSSDDTHQKQQQFNTSENEATQEPDFFQKSSVVAELMTQYEKNASLYSHNLNNKDSTHDMHILANQAAKEFEILAIQNDELFKEKEQFKQRYDDLYTETQQLYIQIQDIEFVKHENQKLLTENAKYQSQTIIFEQEKYIMQETINNLKEEINSFSVEK
eukprot:UN10978